MSPRMLALLCGAGWMCLSGVATAQVAAVDQPETTVEEVVVRSQRRLERAIDVPVQITALDSRALADQHVLTLEDLQNKVPSAYFGGTSNGTAITVAIRGVGGSVTVFGEEPVAVFFDDQFLARGASATDLLDLDSVEILRGPQGTLYGRNATAGALLLRSARPSLTRFTGQVKAMAAEYDEQRLEAAVGGPLIDGVLGFRLAGLYGSAGGYADNLANPGEKLGRSESGRLRGSVMWAPGPQTTVFALVEAGENRGAGAQARWAVDSSNRVRIPESRIAALKDGDFALNAPQFYESKDLRSLVSVTHSFDGFDLVAEAGYTFADAKAASDSDGTAGNILYNRGAFEDQTYSQDLRLISTGDGPLRWIAGVSLLQNRFQMPYFYIRSVAAGLDLGFFSKLNTQAAAAYAEGAYAWDNGLSLTLGVRATQEKKKADVDRYFVVVSNGFVIDPPLFQGEESWTNISPRAVLSYRVNEDLNLYASYSHGFKGGGFNAFGPDPAYAPEKIVALEAGAKARLMGGRLSLSGAAFTYDYQDLQVRLGVPGGGVAIASAKGARVRGLEVEFNARPIQGLEVFGSASLLDTEYKSFLTPDLAGVLVDAAGGRLSRAPKLQYGVGGAYSWPVTSSVDARIQASANYIGGVSFSPTDQATLAWRGKPYTEVDLRASLAAADKAWELSAFLQNATNAFAVTSIVAAGNFPVASFNKPRTFGIELLRRF